MKVYKSDIIWNYAGTFMSMGSNFLLLPFLIHFLSGDALGLWYVFLSVGGIVILFDFGFNPTFARNVAYCWSGTKELRRTDSFFVDDGEPNISLLKKLITTCKRIYLIIALIAIIILLSIGTIYILHVAEDLSGYSYLTAWFIYSIAVFLNIYYGYYTTFLRGVGAIKEVNIATVLSRLLQIILSIILLYLGLGLVAVASAYLVYGLFFRLISKSLFYKYENIGERLKNDLTITTSTEIKEIFSIVWFNAWRDGMVALSKYLLNQATVIICSLYLSLTETGIYSISMQLLTAIVTISSTLYTTYQPSLQEAYIKKDRVSSKKIMSLVMMMYIGLFWVSLIVLIFIGIPILQLVKQDIAFDIPILLALGLYLFLLNHHSLYASFISNTNRVPYMKAFVGSGILSIAISVLLIELTELGIWGLIIAQLLAQLIYNNWKWPNLVMKELNTTPIEMIKIGLKEINNMIVLRINQNKKRTL